MKEKVHLEDLELDMRIILKRFYKNWDVGAWIGFIWLRVGTGSCKCSNKPSGFIKGWGFLD
jgi:hypothetical protein